MKVSVQGNTLPGTTWLPWVIVVCVEAVAWIPMKIMQIRPVMCNTTVSLLAWRMCCFWSCGPMNWNSTPECSVSKHMNTLTLSFSFYLCWNANEQQPLLFGVCAIVDDLAACQTGMAVKDFDWLRVTLHAPMVDCIVCDQGYSVEGDPLPEGHIVRHRMSLHFTLHLNVKDLQGLCRCKNSEFRIAVTQMNSVTPPKITTTNNDDD